MISNLLISLGVWGLLFRKGWATECSEAYGLVNSFIGSGGPGFGYGGLNPGAQIPYAPLRLGPDTMSNVADVRFQHFSGYWYPDDIIRAFSHNHLVGGGVSDLGVLGVMPFTVKRNQFDDFVGNFSSRFWWSKFDKSTEVVVPGKYSVFLKEPEVQAELLAIGNHAAIHKYTWKAAKSLSTTSEGHSFSLHDHGLMLDLCHFSVFAENIRTDSRCLNASLSVDPTNPNQFTGSVYFDGGLSGKTVYYIHGELKTSSKLIGVKSWRACTGFDPRSDCIKDVSSIESTNGLLFSLATFGFSHPQDDSKISAESGDFSVELRIALSYIDTNQARLNLQDAIGASADDFGVLESRTKTQWCDALSVASFESLEGDDDLQAILYTALYRTMMSPSRYTEAGGVYVGLDRSVHNVTADRLATYGDRRDVSPMSYEWYSDLSLWDTFRTQHPWLLLLNEDLAIGIARSTADMTAQQGAFPRWTLGPNEGSCMIGEHGAAIILEAVLAGFGDEIDVPTIQKALLRQSVTAVSVNGRADVEHYIANGFVRQDTEQYSTSLTLSYAYDDFLLAGLSKHTGDIASASAALLRSQNYRKIWSHSRKFFCPKFENGDLKCPISPIGPQAWGEFKEGDAMHWAWYVLHDVPGLISLFPSPEAYDEALNDFFVKALDFEVTLGNTLPNPYYWAGNEHDFMAPFMFNWGPNCTRTQYWSRQVTNQHFSNTPHGLPGNDDYGSMSSFVLFASLGFYPQAGTTTFLIGSPRVKAAKITLRHFDGSSSVLEVVTHNNAKENVYVERLLVNGVELTTPFIERSVLASKTGVKLEYYMQSVAKSGLCSSVV